MSSWQTGSWQRPRVMADHAIYIDPKMFPFLSTVAPGVFGYTVDDGDKLWVPMLYAEHRGAGDVGRFLDSLPTDRTVIVPNVVNPILEGMLGRRGFNEEIFPIPLDGEIIEEPIPSWVRRPVDHGA